MVIDTSALLAILPVEPERRRFTEAIEAAARHAFTRFGKGRHPAGLNYGDLFSYALARVQDERLLFKGDDFARTDLTGCRRSSRSATGTAWSRARA